ncbi:MAG: sugar isomerase domain-containing protein [bacterium]|nr:sugar isomerase domain-containing protein [bacterium]
MTLSPITAYIDACRAIADRVEAQRELIHQTAELFTKSILAGRMVHLFGSGHSRILVEEMWPRYGSFPGFNPIVELSLTFHHPVVGPNGQRQAMFLENVSGLAERILRNFDFSTEDSALVVSSSGCNVVPIEMAQGFQRRGIKVAAIVSQKHADVTPSKHPAGVKLQDCADIVLDTGAPAGDAMVHVEGLDTPVAPGSTVGGCMLINCIKAEVAAHLTQAGHPPRVLSGAAVVGAPRAAQLFEDAYDEHARRLARLYERIGEPAGENS